MRSLKLRTWPGGRSHHLAKVGDVVRLGFQPPPSRGWAYAPARIYAIDPGDVELTFTMASLGEVRRRIAPADKRFRLWWDESWHRRFKGALPVFRVRPQVDRPARKNPKRNNPEPAEIERRREALLRGISRASARHVLTARGVRQLRAKATLAQKRLVAGCSAPPGARARWHEKAANTLMSAEATLAGALELHGAELPFASAANPIDAQRMRQSIKRYRQRIGELRNALMERRAGGHDPIQCWRLLEQASRLLIRAEELTHGGSKGLSQALSYLSVVGDNLRRVEDEALPRRQGNSVPRRHSVARDHPPATDLRRGAKTFELWHGRRPKRTSRISNQSRKIPSTLVKLGEIPEIIYTSNKWGGSRKTYTHTTGRPRPILATDPSGRSLFIVGGRVRVTERGLEG